MRPEDMSDLRSVLEEVAGEFCLVNDTGTERKITGHDSYSGFGNDGHVRVTFAPKDGVQNTKITAKLDEAVRVFGASHKDSQFEVQVVQGTR